MSPINNAYLQERIKHISPHHDIIIMDNSSLSVWEECNRKFLYRVLMSLKLPTEKVAITFGKAFHKFLEMYYAGKSFEESYRAFVETTIKDSSKIKVSREESAEANSMSEYSLEFGFLLCKKYVETHPLDSEYWEPLRTANDEYYLEMGFAIDLPNGIIIGLMDGIGRIKRNNKKIVAEHKTTKYNINSSYLSDFNPNNQVSTYLYAASEFLGEPVDTALINVIRVKDYKRGDPEENAEKLFGRIETLRSPEQLEQRMRHANFQLGQIKQSIDAGLDGFPMHTQSCRTRFGECEYRSLCMAHDERMIQILAESSFKVDPWSPYNVFEDIDKVIEIKTEQNKVEVKDAEEFVQLTNL